MKGAAEGGDIIKPMKEKKFQREQRGGKSEEKSGMLFWWSSAPIKPSIDICTDALGPVGLENFSDQMFGVTIVTSTEMPSHYFHAPRFKPYRLKPN